jgi:uncharacterized protein YegP (UPF0339 family)
MTGKFVISRTSNGEYRFDLTTGNGQIIATSETYPTKADARAGIESVKANAADASVEDETRD